MITIISVLYLLVGMVAVSRVLYKAYPFVDKEVITYLWGYFLFYPFALIFELLVMILEKMRHEKI